MLGHLVGDASARARFQREIRNSARIEHPHVVPVYDAGYEDGHFFIAMRLVDGPDLGNSSQRAPCPLTGRSPASGRSPRPSRGSTRRASSTVT